MQRIKLLAGLLLGAALLAIVLIQGRASIDELASRVSSTEEKIINKLPIGPYYITVEGERFVDSGYFRIDVTSPNNVPTDQLDIVVDLEPTEWALEELADSSGAALAATSIEPDSLAQTFVAEYRNGEYFVDSLPFHAAEEWLVNVRITDSDGAHSGEFDTFVWPRSPEPPLPFVIGSIVLPIAIAIGTIGLFAMRGVRLMQPRQRETTE
ncbi:MAG: hypothetical protein MI924_36170 [Chloroflexales bacterium]|nr:hypothetical protein [Chloroflexales bacterium]